MGAMKNVTSLLLVSSLTIGTIALGCLHFDRSYSGILKEGTKGALLFHDGKSAHLVVRTELTASKGSLPDEIAWVMPFPSLPSKYEEVSPEVFKEVSKLIAASLGYGVTGRKGPMPRSKSVLKVHDAAVAGDYTIQPIEITAESDGKEFNDWLSQHRFNPMPQDLQRSYLHKGAVFLAIRAKLTGKASDLKPIHIIYPATDLTFPLKFTHDNRIFDLDLYTITKAKVAPGSFDKRYLTQISSLAINPSIHSAAGASEAAKLVANAGGFLTKFEGRGLNVGNRKLRNLAKDPTFAP
jgi:hypothetical protein